jgi:hypothetical protein
MGSLTSQKNTQDVNSATFSFFESGNQLSASNPHGTLLLNNKLYVSTNNGQFLVLNDVNGSLSDITSVSVGLGAIPELTYDSNTNRIYGVGTSVFYVNPSNLNVTTTSIPGGNSNASITNDGTYLYIAPGTQVGIIKKYRISDHQFIENYTFNPAGAIHAIKMSPDNQYVLGTVAGLTNPPSAPSAPAGFMVRAKVSDSSTSTFQYNTLIPSDPLYGLAGNATDDFALIDKKIFIGDEFNRNVAIINWETLTLDKSIDINSQDLGTYCWFSSTDSRYVFFGARRNRIYIYDSLLDIGKIFNLPISLSPFESINECVYIGNNTWIATNYATNFRFFRFKINLTQTKSLSIKKQNLTVSGYGIALVNGIYKLQNTLINGRNWYLHDSLLFNVRWNNSTSRWNLLSNQGVELSVATNSTDNPWEATWSNNVQVSSGSGGKISLKSSAIPLNTLNIRVNNGPSNAPWGVGGSGPCGNDFQLLNNQNGIWSQGHLGCDFYVAWDNKYGTLPYRWRLYYDSDGRLDYAEHPTATQEALPSKGWDNGMTISIV